MKSFVIVLTLLASVASAYSQLTSTYTYDPNTKLYTYDFGLESTDTGAWAANAVFYTWGSPGYARIVQISVDGWPVNTEAQANSVDGIDGYVKAGDTWVYSPFVQLGRGFYSSNERNFSIHVGTLGGTMIGATNLIHIVSTGYVDVYGSVARHGIQRPIPQPVCFLPDANDDHQVTDADYVDWANNYRKNFGARSCTREDGDFNGDGEVTDADYIAWAENYGRGMDVMPDLDPTPFPGGDLNRDMLINDADYTIWAENPFEIDPGPFTPYGLVPEPASLALLGAGVLTLLRRRKA